MYQMSNFLKFIVIYSILLFSSSRKSALDKSIYCEIYIIRKSCHIYNQIKPNRINGIPYRILIYR